MSAASTTLVNQTPPSPPVNPNYKPPASAGGIKQYVLTADTGDVVVRWPETLSAEDLKRAEAFLEDMKLKMKRSIQESSRAWEVKHA